MKYSSLNDEQKEDIVLKFNNTMQSKAQSVLDIREKYSIGQRTAYEWIDKITSEREFKKIELENNQLRHDINAFKKKVKDADIVLHDDERLRNLIVDVKTTGFDSCNFDWLKNPSNKKNNIVPVIAISDIHLGETVNAKDVNLVNEYSSEIAEKRVRQCVDDFIDVYVNKFTNYEYDGCVLILPGDNITNELHDLAETNDASPVDQIISCVNLLKDVIMKLKKSFGKVHVFAVTGNHGRLQPKGYTKTKGRYNHSLEKVVYHFLSREFIKNKNIGITTSPSDIVRFSINGTRFQLEHGDTIRGTGNAIAGPITAFERSRIKKSAVASATDSPFDVLIIGHFHTHFVKNNFILFNSVKGYDEYVQMLGIPYALPGCTTFAVNSRGQVIFATDLQCRDKVKREHEGDRINTF